jgi:hypothetical protein
MGFLGDLKRAVTSLPRQVKQATIGKGGIVGKGGAGSLLIKGKIARAAKATGRSVSLVAGNPIISSTFGSVAIPADIVAAAVSKGPTGALEAAKRAVSNPLTKAKLAALAIVMPPMAPLSAGGLASMEAASRLVDGLQSKDPRIIASAATSLAVTMAEASRGNPDAKRALAVIDEVREARKVLASKVPGLINRVQNLAARGDPRAQKTMNVLSAVKVRAALRTTKSTNKVVAAKARKVVAAAQKKAPDLVAGMTAAVNTPRGLRVGDVAVLSTGRLLLRGRPIRKAS